MMATFVNRRQSYHLGFEYRRNYGKIWFRGDPYTVRSTRSDGMQIIPCVCCLMEWRHVNSEKYSAHYSPNHWNQLYC